MIQHGSTGLTYVITLSLYGRQFIQFIVHNLYVYKRNKTISKNVVIYSFKNIKINFIYYLLVIHNSNNQKLF